MASLPAKPQAEGSDNQIEVVGDDNEPIIVIEEKSDWYLLLLLLLLIQKPAVAGVAKPPKVPVLSTYLEKVRVTTPFPTGYQRIDTPNGVIISPGTSTLINWQCEVPGAKLIVFARHLPYYYSVMCMNEDTLELDYWTRDQQFKREVTATSPFTFNANAYNHLGPNNSNTAELETLSGISGRGPENFDEGDQFADFRFVRTFNPPMGTVDTPFMSSNGLVWEIEDVIPRRTNYLTSNGVTITGGETDSYSRGRWQDAVSPNPLTVDDNPLVSILEDAIVFGPSQMHPNGFMFTPIASIDSPWITGTDPVSQRALEEKYAYRSLDLLGIFNIAQEINPTPIWESDLAVDFLELPLFSSQEFTAHARLRTELARQPVLDLRTYGPRLGKPVTISVEPRFILVVFYPNGTAEADMVSNFQFGYSTT